MGLPVTMIRKDFAPLVGKLRVRVFELSLTYIMIFLGVLTKPDRTPEASHEKWVRFVEGEAEPLHHGWFCVKLHDTETAHQQPTLADVREQEDQWFNKTSIWRRLRQARSHLGTKRLVQHLEEILSELITTRYATIYFDSKLMMNNTFVDL
jgi:dynamin family protein